MRSVFIVGDSVVSPLGFTTAENFIQLSKGSSSITLHEDASISAQPFYASIFDKTTQFLHSAENRYYSKFEQMVISAVGDALTQIDLAPSDPSTVFILSSTKGNIGLLEKQPNGKTHFQLGISEPDEPRRTARNRVTLPVSAQLIKDYFHFSHQPIIVSHACISGMLAILTGMRLIQSGLYENAVVAGADVISRFIMSGFESFQAISAKPCKPFDAQRDGISLGEAAGALVLSARKSLASDPIQVGGGAVTNDANHISGPSRTGEELFQAMQNAMKDAGVNAAEIDFISAHGTATLYNDEMEAKAIHLAAMESVPVNSLKGYYGHTLGAAGLIESIISVQSMRRSLLLPTKGFSKAGTSNQVNVRTVVDIGPLKACLKTGSGFGGCNAALVFCKPY